MANAPGEGRSPEADENEGGPVKSFLEHLEDLRWTLIKSASAIAVGVLLCLLAGNYVVAILMRPLEKAVIKYPGTNQVVTLSFGTNRLGTFNLDTNLQASLNLGTNRFVALQVVPVDITSGSNQFRVLALQPNTNVNAAMQAQHMNTSLMALGPAKAFLVGFRVALYAGIALASPFIFFFVGEFVLPALKITERKYLYRGLGFAIPLFLCGVLFCYFILMPAALAASQMYADWFGFSSNLWDAGEYIGFVCKFMLGMGLGFELPVVILVLVKIGILNYQMLKRARPYMIVINLILGAVLTTPEVFTQVLMAIPLQLLFELSLLIVWYWERQERKRVEAEGGEVIDPD
jgi:sec-independent protein translocase protein TatC